MLENRIKGEGKMSFSEFDMSEIEKTQSKYGKETKEKWGNTKAYSQSQIRTSRYTNEDWEKINTQSKKIFFGFAKLVNEDPGSEKAKELVIAWKNHITKYYYDCSDEILNGLADMYIYDKRFKNNIDKHGQGTTQFLSDAIKIYCEQKINNGENG